MPRQTRLTNFAVDAQANLLGALLDGGFIDVMDGKQPESGDVAIADQQLLVVLGFGIPAFVHSQEGVIFANAISSGVAVGAGNPTWFRAYRSDHRTPIFDGSVGRENANMILPVRTIVEGVLVHCSSLSHTVVKSLSGI